MEKGNYKRMGFILIVSFLIMYGVMFLNVTDPAHIYISITRFYMALLMVSPMALLMLIMMKQMYKNKVLNAIIGVGAILIFFISLICLRKQIFISDAQYMKAMIPHHSSAILTSRHAAIHDPEVKELSEGIILSQEQEINEMQTVLERMEK